METITREDVLEIVESAMFYDDVDSAIIGVVERCGLQVVCYDYDKLIKALSDSYLDEDFHLDEDEKESGITIEDKKNEAAIEWYEYNINGGYNGELTPMVLRQV